MGCQSKCAKSCSTCKRIAQKSFRNHCDDVYTTTLTLSEPGKYCLVEDIVHSPANAGDHAIVVDADDVTLDLCGHVLEQGNDVTSVIGVVLKAGRSNFTLLGSNGTIRNFSQAGIYLQGTNNEVQLGDDTSLVVSNCGGTSEKSFLADGAPQWQGGVILGGSGFLNLAFGFPYLGQITNLVVRRLIIQSCDPIGMFWGNGRNWRIEDCAVLDTTTARYVGAPFGILFASPNLVYCASVLRSAATEASNPVEFLRNVSVTGTTFNHSFVGDYGEPPVAGPPQLLVANGVDIYNMNGASFTQCQFNEHTIAKAGRPDDGFTSFVTGCLLRGTSGTKLEQCEFSRNETSIRVGVTRPFFVSLNPQVAPGLSSQFGQASLLECIVEGNISNSSVLANGTVQAVRASAGTLNARSVIVRDNLSLDQSTESAGFYLESSRNTKIIDCEVSGFTAPAGTNFVEGGPQGFPTAASKTNAVYVAGPPDDGLLIDNLNVYNTNESDIIVTGFRFEGVGSIVGATNLSNAIIKNCNFDKVTNGIVFSIFANAFGSSNVSILDNVLKGANNAPPGVATNGIATGGVDERWNIKGNEVSNFTNGVVLLGGSNHNVESNTIRDTTIGVFVPPLGPPGAPPPTRNSSILRNYFENSLDAAVVDLFDGPVPAPTTNLIAQNKSYADCNQGEYAALYPNAPLPVRQSNLNDPAPFPVDAEVCDNTLIQRVCPPLGANVAQTFEQIAASYSSIDLPVPSQ